MSDSEVVLGIKFSDMDTFQGENLYFSGTALEEGVWTDAHGNTAFYPAGVIREAAKAFEGVDILCEHRGVPIGKIIKTNPTELGFEVVEGVITSQRMIAAIRENEKRGLSVRALVELDPIRKVVKRIFNPEEISLVEAPACKVCMLDEITEKEVSNSEFVEESTMAENEYPEPDCEQFKQDDKIYMACKEFASAVETFKKAQATWHGMFANEDTDPNEAETEMSDEVVEVANSTPVEEVTEEIAAEVVEEDEEVETEIKEEVIVEDETVVEEIVAESGETEEVTEEVTVEEVTVEDAGEVVLGASDEVEELKAKLESAEIALASSMAELSVTKAELSALKDKVRSELVESVMSADPNADSALINGMSDTQLAAYKETVMRLSKPTVGAEKQSVKSEQAPVELAAPEVKVEKKALSLADGIIAHLGRKQ